MTKSRKLSVRLLKENLSFHDSYKDDFNNLQCISQDQIFGVYLIPGTMNAPWWKDYLGIQNELLNATNSAILTVNTSDRIFVYTFGFAHNKLYSECFEENFGFLVTLNSLDGQKLKSIDAYSPASNTKQKRVVSSILSNIYEYDFNDNEDLIQKISGVIKEEFKELFTNPTGTDSLSINSKSTKEELKNISDKLLERFLSNDYLNDPNLKNINKIKKADKTKVTRVNSVLIDKLNNQDYSDIYMADLEILNSAEFYAYKFGNNIFYDLCIENLNLGQDLSIEKLNSMRISVLRDVDDRNPVQWNLYKCLVFDHENFFLSKGTVYEMEQNFLADVNKSLSKFRIENYLPNARNAEKEGIYNERVTDNNTLFLFDKNCPRIEGRGSVEICDIYDKTNNRFIHIKRAESSASLSHLWSQGVVSEQIANTQHPKYKEKFHEVTGIDLPETRCIWYGIIKKSKTLPIFSKISLYNNINILKSMGKKDDEIKYFFIGIDN